MNLTKKSPLHCTRLFYTWLNTVFNKVDYSRIKDVGPDRAAAEWLLKCGASVKWKNYDNWVTDYNILQTQSFKNVIEEIDATESCIMHIGFPYLSGLNYLRRIKFCKCIYLEDTCMTMLSVRKDSLHHLDVISCGNITDKGILAIADIRKLQSLYLYDLPEVKNVSNCIEVLQKTLPECKITFREYEK
ncbi:hypothetical protein JTE90_022981 [Oedothorax gibbosus]|uniref:Mitochondrial ATP synthase regulatory component factor B n=1 Tax=Oedothorax gibbosus TaxID=931172 RepID=A0AAV6VBD9_9ARAC|nr:hypothetical protein JTE90_022981 [Oedothorax gibbosus]